MTQPILTLRQLNRATLARQLLLERESFPVDDSIRFLAGLQAQVAREPYIGLWTRLRDFQRNDLTQLLEQHKVVRTTFVRSTLHLVTADDYLLLRPAIQPALTRALYGFFGKRARNLELTRLAEAARAYLQAGPRTFTELRALLLELEPNEDAEAMAYVVRTQLPLVQVPRSTGWGYPSNPAYALADLWLGQSLLASENPHDLILRYLAAFGPATIKDVQTWVGMTGLREAVETLKPKLSLFQDERGNELLDLPDITLPPADIPAPPRFVPEYDNLILSHADRTRFVADEHRSSIYLPAGRVRATFLVDGFVRGTWKIEKTKNSATLVIEPFVSLSKEVQAALSEEGEQLIRFIEEESKTFGVRFAAKE